jgi:hypothetical protein
LLPLRLPASLNTVETDTINTQTTATANPDTRPGLASHQGGYQGGPVELDRVVPVSGNLAVRGKPFWLGPARSGVTVTFWADCDIIHLTIAGARVKTVRDTVRQVRRHYYRYCCICWLSWR